MITSLTKAQLNTYLNGFLYTCIFLLGASVVFGWILNASVLVRIVPGLAPMQFNNAVCFMLIGASGFAHLYKHFKLQIAFASVGLLVSSLTLVQYIFSINLGIDLFLMNTQVVLPTAHPGRMAPNSALAHTMSFCALILLASRNNFHVRLSSWLGAAVASTGVVSLAGYLIDFDGGFNWGQYTQMALNTSVGFVLAGIAIGVTTIPYRMRNEGRKFRPWPYIIILLITVFLIDLQLPQGVAVGLLYVVPLLGSWYFRNRKHIITVAVLCNILIVLDILLATESLGSEAVLYNRVMSILAVWVSASIFYYLKRISEKQKEADLRFKLAVEGSAAGLWVWESIAEDIAWWSPKFYELMGYENNEIEASLSNFDNYLHPDDVELVHKLIGRHLTKKLPYNCEYRVLTKSGKYKWFLGSGQATWDEDGTPLRMVGTIIDINARKLAEVAEQERADELARKNKELEEFTYVASHDLQEPVRTISSFVSLFKQSYGHKLDEEAMQYLDFMDGASKRSQQLIVDLLDYSRIGKDRKTEEINLNQLLENVLTDLSVRLSETNAKVKVDPLPEIQGLKTELRLLFQNLISNGIKFSRKDTPPVVQISVTSDAEKHTFSVSDNGIGIDPKYIDKIFVIFKRLHGKSEFAGTGIGLAHCKKVVELHGGQIWVESIPNQGSTFKFTIPTTIEL